MQHRSAPTRSDNSGASEHQPSNWHWSGSARASSLAGLALWCWTACHCTLHLGLRKGGESGSGCPPYICHPKISNSPRCAHAWGGANLAQLLLHASCLCPSLCLVALQLLLSYRLWHQEAARHVALHHHLMERIAELCAVGLFCCFSATWPALKHWWLPSVVWHDLGRIYCAQLPRWPALHIAYALPRVSNKHWILNAEQGSSTARSSRETPIESATM